MFAVLLLALLLAACSDDAATTAEDLTGVFVDSPVSGLDFSTPTVSGTTNAQGQFRYRAGEMVSFHLGAIPFGSAQGRSRMTPMHLVPGATTPGNTEVLNRLRFLQSLDEDDDPSNGINLSAAIRAWLETHSGVDFTQTTFTPDMTGSGKTLVDAPTALDHFAGEQQADFSGIVVSTYPQQGGITSEEGLQFATVAFAIEMDATTFSTESVIIDTLGPSAVQDACVNYETTCGFAYDAESKTLTITTTAQHICSDGAMITLLPAVKDATGASLPGPYSWSFSINNTFGCGGGF
jgi:hypothetical protein